MLPNFLVVGAQKAGTTSLHNYLITHPDIYLPVKKESKFFVINDRYRKGLNYYQSLFEKNTGQKAIGEIDPDYLYIEKALDRIVTDLDIKNMKFIFIFRNPIERAFSHYLMSYRRGIESLTFKDAVNREQERIKLNHDNNMHFSYITRGFYFYQLQRFLKYIRKEQMLFLTTDEMKYKKNDFFLDTFNFLEVNPNFYPDNIQTIYHTASFPLSMKLLRRIHQKDTFEKIVARWIFPNKELRIKLKQWINEKNQSRNIKIGIEPSIYESLLKIYKPQNKLLQELINKNLEHWNYKLS